MNKWDALRQWLYSMGMSAYGGFNSFSVNELYTVIYGNEKQGFWKCTYNVETRKSTKEMINAKNS